MTKPMFILLSLGFGPVRLTINFNSPIRLHDTDMSSRRLKSQMVLSSFA